MTRSFDGTLRLRDRETGQQLGRSLDATDPQLAADGTVLLTVGAGYVSVWNLDTSTWVDLACEFARRKMTATEWRQFGPTTVDYHATCPDYPLPD